MFFSVKVPMKIGAKSFKTCICYALPDYMKKTVEELAEKGKAEIYSEQRFFCNGKLVELKKKTSVKTVKKASKKTVIKEATVAEEAVTEDGTSGF